MRVMFFNGTVRCVELLIAAREAVMRRRHNDSGRNAVEYGILIVVIAAVIIAMVSGLGALVKHYFGGVKIPTTTP